MEQLQVAVIGAGFIGKQHIEAIRRIPGTHVRAIVESNEALAEEVCRQLAVPIRYHDVEEMLRDQEIQVVHNCTPNALHYSINKAAIAAGKHIYCEKPLTLTVTEAEELARLAKEKHVAAGVNLNYRHNVMVKEMRWRTKSTLGKVLTVYGEYLQDWLMFDTDYDWRMDPRLGGESRAVADIGSHCFDTLQYILDRKITSVFAKFITVFPERKRCETSGTFSGGGGRVLETIPIQSEDAAYIMVQFEDGTPGLVHLTQVCAGKKNGLAVNISGQRYSMEWHQERADRLQIGRREAGNEELYADGKLLSPEAAPFAGLPAGHAVAWHDALKNAIHVFYRSIMEKTYRNPDQDYVNFEEGRRLMRLVEACVESSRTGVWVSV